MPFSTADPRNYAAISKQNAAGTEGTVFNFIKFTNDAVISTEIEAESVFEAGDGQDQGLHYKRSAKADGQVECFARPLQFTYLAALAMGSGISVASVSSTDIASHMYVPNATIPNCTIEQSFAGGNEIERVSDAKLSGFTVEGEAGQPWKLTVPFIGGGTPYYRDGSASALTPSVEAGDVGMYAGGAYLIDGATSFDIRKWTFAFERNMDDSLWTVNIFRRTVVELSRTLTVTGEVIFQSNSLWKKITYGAAAASMIGIRLATGSFHAETSMASAQSVKLDVPCMNYLSTEVTKGSPEGQTVILTFTARAVKAGTSLCQISSNVIGRATSYLVNW